MKRFDVAIVGAGPAGSATAIMLGRLGYSVALIDRQVFPREKLCGDFVNPVAVPLIQRLGAESEILTSPHQRVTGFRISSFTGGEAEFPFQSTSAPDLRGLGIARVFLDRVLLRNAAAAGATVLTGWKAVELKRTGTWELRAECSDRALAPLSARILVGADGRNSWVAHKLGLVTSRSVDAEAVGFQLRFKFDQGLDGNVEIHLFPGGYAGLVGIGNGIANLCLAIRRDALRGAPAEDYLLHSCLPHNPRLKALLESSSPLGAARAVYPVYFPPRPCYIDGALLVGDAARVSEPVTGEGIYAALKSGIIAADTIDAACRNGDLSARGLAPYARACARAFRARRGINALIRRVVYRPRLVSPLMQSSSLTRHVLRPIVQAICTPAGDT